MDYVHILSEFRHDQRGLIFLPRQSLMSTITICSNCVYWVGERRGLAACGLAVAGQSPGVRHGSAVFPARQERGQGQTGRGNTPSTLRTSPGFGVSADRGGVRATARNAFPDKSAHYAGPLSFGNSPQAGFLAPDALPEDSRKSQTRRLPGTWLPRRRLRPPGRNQPRRMRAAPPTRARDSGVAAPRRAPIGGVPGPPSDD